MTEKNSLIPLFGSNKSCLRKIKSYDIEEEGGESRHSFAT